MLRAVVGKCWQPVGKLVCQWVVNTVSACRHIHNMIKGGGWKQDELAFCPLRGYLLRLGN